MKAQWVPLLFVGALACGQQSPQTYEECLVQLGRERPSDDAIAVCREAFPDVPGPAPETPFYSGTFYYTTSGAQCSTIGFRSDGRIDARDAGFCGGDSRIECDGDTCRLTCRNYNRSDTSVVRRLELRDAGIVMVPSDSLAYDGISLWRLLADCEEQMATGRSMADFLEGLPTLPMPDSVGGGH